MQNNLGYARSSLLNVFGWSTPETEKVLKARDGISIKSATRKHKLDKSPTSRHRKKVECKTVGEIHGLRPGIKKGIPRTQEPEADTSRDQPGPSRYSTKRPRRGKSAYSPGGGD